MKVARTLALDGDDTVSRRMITTAGYSDVTRSKGKRELGDSPSRGTLRALATKTTA